LETAVPITFPCDRCAGTLSIAKRKAYALIDCPKCGCKQVVPGESRPGRLTANGTPLPEPPLFERADFENLLGPTLKKAADPTASAPIVTVPESLRPAPAPAPAATATLPFAPAPAPRPLDLIPLRRVHLILAAVLVAVLLVLTFGVGVLVGKATS
jgi:hypothetical protein